MAGHFFLFAPGAGAGSAHPWMAKWGERLAALGAVRALDYPYMLEGGRRPDPLPRLVAAHREALRRAREELGNVPVLIGKSMGSRVGCHVSLEEPVGAVICMGYPLCGGGDPAKLRDKVLLAMTAPVLFIQGTRDSLCPLDLLETVRARMTAVNELFVVEGGDHSLLVRKKDLNGLRQEDVDNGILAVISKFVAAYAG